MKRSRNGDVCPAPFWRLQRQCFLQGEWVLTLTDGGPPLPGITKLIVSLDAGQLKVQHVNGFRKTTTYAKVSSWSEQSFTLDWWHKYKAQCVFRILDGGHKNSLVETALYGRPRTSNVVFIFCSQGLMFSIVYTSRPSTPKHSFGNMFLLCALLGLHVIYIFIVVSHLSLCFCLQ